MPAPHPLTVRDFRFYLAARFSLTLAQNAMVVVIGWQAYDIARRTMGITDSAFQLGLIGAAQFVPLLVLALIVGWVADRVDRRWVARASVLLEFGCAITLALLTAHGHTTLPSLFAIAALLGVARAFAGPSMGALAPNIVSAAALPTAIALSSIAWQTGGIVGPALGGYLYAAEHWLPYAVAAGLFGLSLLALLLIGPIPRSELDRTADPWRQMIEGLHYLRRNRIVLGAISLDLFAVLLGGATAMLPIFARDILHVGSEGLGHLRAAPAAGAALTALFFSIRPITTNVGPKMLAAVVIFGLATVLFGLSRAITEPLFGPAAIGREFGPAMLVALACLAVLGAADMFSVYIRQSLIQIWTPNAMRGRVGAVSTLFISGSNELGEAESGFVAALIGPVAGVVVGGIGAVLVVFAWSRWFPELRRVKTFAPPETLQDMPGQNGPGQDRPGQTAPEQEMAR